MITSNIIHRVFQIRHGNGTGTAFTVDHKNREYLITAAHVVEGLQSGEILYIKRNGNWVEHPVVWIASGAGGLDVAVVRIAEKLTPDGLPAEATDGDLVYGQDAYFLGFPYGWVGHFRTHNGFPLPFVKRATVSLLDPVLMYLDGHNNPGFSGAPVVFVPPGHRDWRIAGVVSGYLAMKEAVELGDEMTDYSAQVNTGIITSYRISKALELVT